MLKAEGGALMDWYPLINSLRIALISTFITFFLGILAAYYIAKTPRLIKGILDVILTLPLVLPPTVIGFFILKLMGPRGPVGSLLFDLFQTKVVMTWYSAIFATVIITFPLMYRTVRGAFESFDMTLKYAGQTLGLRNTYIFWHIMMPYCKQGIIAGTVLSFARALGEYGATSMVAGYTPGKTATISTTVYQLWRTGDDLLAYRWVAINVAISFVVLIAINFFERNYKKAGGKRSQYNGLA
jgi:molybdate transport system permease protein